MTNTGHPSQPCPCRGRTGAATCILSRSQHGAKPGRGEEEETRRNYVNSDTQPNSLRGSSLAPRGAPEGSRQPLQGSLSGATSPHQAFRDKKTSFYSCGKHMSISPAGNASAGWCAGGSPGSLVLVPRGCTVCPQYPLLIPSVCPSAQRHYRHPFLVEPCSGGAPSTPCTQSPTFAVAKEETTTFTAAAHVSSHPNSSSWAHFWQQLLTKASPAVLPHWDPQAVITGCATSWSFPLAISHPLLSDHFPTT